MTTPTDYGPVPVSRLKDDVHGVFSALEHGQRVLVSRHGQVVAAIDPASIARHTPTLAAFALRAPSVSELTATEIGQGSPSEAVRRAGNGEQLLVTRNNRVYGVLGRPAEAESLDEVIAQEQTLADFEQGSPEVGAEEFAEASSRARDDARSDIGPVPPLSSGAGAPASSAEDTVVDAMLVKGMVLEASSDLAGAAGAFRAALPTPTTRTPASDARWGEPWWNWRRCMRPKVAVPRRSTSLIGRWSCSCPAPRCDGPRHPDQGRW